MMHYQTDGFIADCDTLRNKHICDVAATQVEPMVEPDSMGNSIKLGHLEGIDCAFGY